MEKDFIVIDGHEVRVESNWNSMVAFLREKGSDSLGALTTLQDLKPSDIADLMAACVNEGERLEGRDTHYTGLDLGAICGIEEMTQFIQIYAKQTAVKATPGKAKKKKEQ